MKTENVGVVPFKEIGNRQLVVETEPQASPRMKTIKAVAKLTSMSYTSLRNLCLENQIVHIRVGKKYLINYDRFIDYLNGVGCA